MTQAELHFVILVFTAFGNLTKITDYAGNATTFSYTTTSGVKYLTGVTHPDGTTVPCLHEPLTQTQHRIIHYGS